jgi:hypothetical protein
MPPGPPAPGAGSGALIGDRDTARNNENRRVETCATERGVFGGIFKYGYLGVVENGLFTQYTEKTIVIVGEQKSVE